MGSHAAAHFAHLRRLAFTKEVQDMAMTFVKYGSAAYCFRTYVMGLTAVNFEPTMLACNGVQQKHAWDYFESPGMPCLKCTSYALQCTGPSMFPTLNSRGDTPLLPFSLPFFNIKGDLILLEHFSVLAKIIKVGKYVLSS